MSLDAYWNKYDSTLSRIRAEKPTTFAALKEILDSFEPPSSGDAFFPGGADDSLADALHDAGWHVNFQEGDYLWLGTSPAGHRITYVEGDVYEGNQLLPRD